jgi:purine-binding chemotaxis protein CheW
MASEIEAVLNRQANNLSFEHDKEDKGSQYLSFDVGGEEFAVNILSVQEIRGWEIPTFLPNSPDYIKGVLNLRGTIVPVMDLRTRFRFRNEKYLETTVIIILKTTSDNFEKLMGCVVDGVSDVFNIEESEIGEVPDYGSGVDSQFASGVMSVSDNAVTLLELSNLLSLDLIDHPYTGEA